MMLPKVCEIAPYSPTRAAWSKSMGNSSFVASTTSWIKLKIHILFDFPAILINSVYLTSIYRVHIAFILGIVISASDTNLNKEC